MYHGSVWWSCHSWRRCWMTVSWADTTGWHYNLASNKRSIMKISQTSLGMIVVHCILCDKDLLFMRHWSLLKSISSMATMTRLNQIHLNDFIHSILSSSRPGPNPGRFLVHSNQSTIFKFKLRPQFLIMKQSGTLLNIWDWDFTQISSELHEDDLLWMLRGWTEGGCTPELTLAQRGVGT